MINPSFNDVMTRLRDGDDAAAREVFHRFAQRLIGLARSRLDLVVRAKCDPEDVMQSVYCSFFRRHAEERFDLTDWDGLWALLTVIAVRKCGGKADYFLAARRDARRETNGDGAHAAAADPTPSHAAMLTETVEELMRDLDGRERDILALSLQGHDAAAISEQIGRTERTVQRVLKKVRERLEAMNH